MKVRIGNDIRLSLRLNFGTKDINILQMLVYAINATLKEKLNEEYWNKNRFVGRFPIEPFTNEFQPDLYNINSSGKGIYRAIVTNDYSGFGVNPNWDRALPVVEKNVTEYRCEVVRTKDPSLIIASFPAIDQKNVGVYDIVVVANIADSGYENGSRTITADYKNAFELVDNSQQEGVISPIGIEVNDVFTHFNDDLYVVSGEYSDDSIILTRNDSETIGINVPKTGWIEDEDD